MADALYKVALSLIPKIGPKGGKNLLAYMGSLEAVFESPMAKFQKIPGIGDYLAGHISKHRAEALRKAETELDFVEQQNLHMSFYLDKDFPFYLKQTEDSPIVLYSKGKIDFRNRHLISIVGTRKASPYGKEICENLVKGLAAGDNNPIIVSGLAYGIDVCAHRAALKYGLDTLAVLGHGLNRLYPASHRETAEKIVNTGGALMSEFTSNSAFMRKNFLRRNRIIAGVSEATVVVESAKKGGSLVTAEIANSYNREVFAFPGRVGDKYSEGCNALIKKHKAYIIESAADIEYILPWSNAKGEPKQKQLFVKLSKDEKSLTDVLKENRKANIDTICKTTGMPPAKTSAVLLELEFKGVVKNLPGKMFELARNIVFE